MDKTNKAVGRPVYEKAASIMRRHAWRIAALLLSACLWQGAAAQESASSDIDYRLGNGLRIPGTGLALGGYATAGYEHLAHQPARTSLDNMSLFVWWEGEGRWKFFSELDYEHVLSTHPSHVPGEKRYLALERLYFDYSLSDSATVRVGKFLTPIGRWNLIHATPLVWTTSRPLVTTFVFPTNATGLMATGTVTLGETPVDYSLYASNGSEIRPNPALDPFNEAVGGHLSFPLGTAQLGLSYAAFEQKNTRDEKKRLAGFDFLWTKDRYEISAEGVYRFSDNGAAWDEKGAFVQMVAPLSEKLYAVGRYEAFRKAGEAVTTEIWVAGINYRITPAVVLKAEWVEAQRNRPAAPEGFMSSLCILF